MVNIPTKILQCDIKSLFFLKWENLPKYCFGCLTLPPGTEDVSLSKTPGGWLAAPTPGNHDGQRLVAVSSLSVRGYTSHTSSGRSLKRRIYFSLFSPPSIYTVSPPTSSVGNLVAGIINNTLCKTSKHLKNDSERCILSFPTPYVG